MGRRRGHNGVAGTPMLLILASGWQPVRVGEKIAGCGFDNELLLNPHPSIRFATQYAISLTAAQDDIQTSVLENSPARLHSSQSKAKHQHKQTSGY